MDIKEQEYEFEEEKDIIKRYLGISTGFFLKAVTFVVFMGIYIGIILYGKNSVDVLLKLQTYKSYLKDDIEQLKQSNAKLQKEYFELKEISGYSEKNEKGF